MNKFDIIIIGTGAGAKIAREAARKGLKTAVIEKDELGGTCLNKGCIPSKMLIHPADVLQELQEAKKFNILVKDYITNFSKLVKEVNDQVGGTSKEIKKKYESGTIENLYFYYGEARFVDNKTISINNELITGKNIVIGTGAKPFVPPIPGLEETPYWTSKEALRTSQLPDTLTILGGGYIGVELGHVYQSFGTKVHYITMEGFIGQVDDDIREEFVEIVHKRAKSTEGNTKQVSYDKEKKQFTLKVEDEKGKNKNIKSQNLLVVTGVKPNTGGLGLENTGIKVDKKGFISVNKHLETSVAGIYSLGDCVGNYMFRHSANFEAEYLIDKLVERTNKKPIKYPHMPWAIFTSPQIAGVGMSEREAKKKGVDYIVGINEYKHSAMGDALRSEHGFVKLLFDKKSSKLLGASIIGEHASIMIHMCIVLLEKKAKLKDFFSFIYIHPALPENVRNAARDANKKFKELK